MFRSINLLEKHDGLLALGQDLFFFYDLRAKKYLDMSCSHLCSLNVGSGYLVCVIYCS